MNDVPSKTFLQSRLRKESAVVLQQQVAEEETEEEDNVENYQPLGQGG